MHGATLLVTVPHDNAASEIGSKIMHIAKTTHATFMLAIFFLKIKCVLNSFWLDCLFDDCNVLGCGGLYSK
jgi:hypothetical protein